MFSDKKSATTFQVRYRSQNDPLIHDETATDIVLTAVDAPNASKTDFSKPPIKTAAQLAEELGLDQTEIRDNEGEAAVYGIYYDDTTYDYMQHMRTMGDATATFIEAPQAASKQRKKGKGKQTLDEAIGMGADEILEPKSTVVRIPKELLPSESEVRRTYQDQQDIPDVLSGFQPDMDPRLREVLEALEDDAYVEDDEDIFGELTKGGEADLDEFLGTEFDDEEDGWGSDTTEKAAPTNAAPKEDGENADWLREFSKFKKAQKKVVKKNSDDGASSLADTMSFGGSSMMSMSVGGTMSVSSRRRKREKKAGIARTASSAYSMSSSALHRTDGLTLLDDRFDRVSDVLLVFRSETDWNRLRRSMPTTKMMRSQ